MTVHTTYFGGVGQYEPSEGADVFGVVRYPKEFVERVTDRNIPAIAPPEDLLNAYKTVEEAAEENSEPNPASIAWNSVSYERRYLEHLEGPGQQAVLAELVDRARERDVWLVCWEKDARWCHRRLLASAVVTQLEDVEVVHHPDPTTIPVEETSDDEEGDPTLADFASGGA
ncbi:DUF488 family protein, N3 subclade [Natrarchaeobaculum sulfurireducens]|uniref:DUF488 domain-containing protein n=1 Tax=Natrarchaeobaculum sulfurireducens TaxID=2044521 RepID=A0A346PS20_9EURY|nr:DUF488 family protein [Natrarchaeobaculum sulfurireducens]AXR82315.1 hypothetical protein AArcMg_2319 [Natrarchaeobaculum sulfurireducens]